MSAPPARHGPPTPLNTDRANSMTSKPGIRLVRYSPPRLSDADERAPSQASSREHAASRSSGNFSDRLPSARSSWRDERRESCASTTLPGSALTSPSSPGFSLAKSVDEQVSGVNPLVSPSIGSRAARSPSHFRSQSDISSKIWSSESLEARRSRFESAANRESSQRTRSQSRRRLRLAVHPNGTFSLVPDEPQNDSRDSLATSSLATPATPSASRSPSAQDRPSLDTWSERGRRASTPLTGISTSVLDTCDTPLSQVSSSTAHPPALADDPSSSSPWNYRLVSGVRKVPSTSEKGKQAAYNTSTASSETQLATLPESPSPTPEDQKEEEDDDNTPTRSVLPKPSFVSELSNQSVETISETTNYKVYGRATVAAQESNDSLLFNETSQSNWEILGQSSPAAPLPSGPPSILTVDDSEKNYVVHGTPSESSASVGTVVRHPPRPADSEESLPIAPLRPTKRRSNERFGYYKQRSRETLRSRTGSFQSVKSFTPSATSSLDPSSSGPAQINLPWTIPETTQADTSSPPASPTGTTSPRLPAPMLRSHPTNQWSSKLSTVMSESEPGSDPARSVSPLSNSTSGPERHRRGSSTGWVSSMYSHRQMASISSSIAEQLNESLEQPQPTHARAQVRMVRDQDEHGDGLADLDHRPSRTGLSAMFNNGSNWTLHSGSSSRCNSFTSSIPAWARVYYGSGERRFLGRKPSFLAMSDVSESRPSSSGVPARSESPSSENFPTTLFSPRKRPHQHQHSQTSVAAAAAGRDSMEITPAPPAGTSTLQPPQPTHQPEYYGVFRTIRQKTSSIWSPHLYADRRANRFSMWEPPKVTWTEEPGLFGRRNVQVFLFVVGFIFPFAWMVAAFLPLPPRPVDGEMSSTGKGKDVEEGNPDRETQARARRKKWREYTVHEMRYESARWWRNLNRIMSVLGFMLIGAMIALAVVGSRQGWT
ncbi:hypothetical protein VTJ04DRAFT_563 [Mycothermus thermophilus]|uniref:uncharacterized protein n=1 Tax=Humicola insolens TaxID=85995 RepID=UPI003742C603